MSGNEPVKRRSDDDSGLGQIIKAEVDVQIRTAKTYPRNVAQAMSRAREMALTDDDSAAACYYTLFREDRRTGETKTITGPSIRMAEIIANTWGNLRVASRAFPVGPDDRFVSVQAAVHDLESNVAVSSEVQRRITTREGKRFGDDMVLVTTNAAMSIAIRNAVFKAVPRALWNPILEACMERQNGAGRGKTLEMRRVEALTAFEKLGISEARILARLGKARVEDIDAEDIKSLRGLYTSLKDEGAAPEELFPPVPEGPRPPPVRTSKPMTAPAAEKPPSDAYYPSGEREPGQEG